MVFHLLLGIASILFPSGFPTKTVYALLLSPIHAICPTHPILLDIITRLLSGHERKSWRSPLCNFRHSPVTSSPLGPNVLFSPSALIHPLTRQFTSQSRIKTRQNYITVQCNLSVATCPDSTSALAQTDHCWSPFWQLSTTACSAPGGENARGKLLSALRQECRQT